MKHYGIENPEGSEIKNLTAPSGTSDPANPNAGELFFRTDQGKLRVHTGSAWEDIVVGSAGIANVVEDTTPQLGGWLDVNGQRIYGTLPWIDASNGTTGGNVFIEAGNGSAGAGGIIRLRTGKSNLNVANNVELITDIAATTSPGLTFGEAGANGNNYIGLKAPNSLTSDVMYVLPTLPTGSPFPTQFLTTDISGNLSWADVTISPAGADTQIQYNNAGAFGAEADFTWNQATNTLTLGSASAGKLTSGTGQVLTVQPGTGASQLSIWGATGTTNGGIVAIAGGYGPTGTGGDINLTAGRGGSGIGGDIIMRPGYGTTSDGHIEIAPNGAGSFRLAPDLRFLEDAANGVSYVAIKAPADVGASRTWVLPQDDPATAAGNFLTTDASGNLSFAAATASPAGSNTQVQFNSSGSFGADAEFTWTTGSRTLAIGTTGNNSGTLKLAAGTGTGTVTTSGGGLTVQPGFGNGQMSVFGATNTTGNGGGVVVAGGYGIGGRGGNVSIQGGTSGGTNAAGAAITITPGAPTGTGADGYVEFARLGGFGDVTPVRFRTGDNSAFVAFTAPATAAANRTWVLPNDDPATAAGNFLTTDASGNLSFAAAGGGISNVVEDTTPQLGGPLDVNGNELQGAPAATATSTGGTLHLRGGAGGATSGSGGAIELTSGAPTSGGGGLINITTANAIGEFDGGNITITSGNGDGTGSTRRAGIITIQAGTSPGTATVDSVKIIGGTASNALAFGGTVSITGGTNSATGGQGGRTYVKGGQGGSTGTGGAVFVQGGTATNGNGGSVDLFGGNANGTGNIGGAISLNAGNGATTGGDIQIVPGRDTTDSSNDGDIQITHPTGSSTAVLVRFKEGPANGGSHVALKAPDAIGANVVWTLPDAQQTSGMMMGIDLGEFTIATLPAAATYPNCWALATDASGGRTIVRSDGTNWKVVVVEGATVA